MTLKVPYNFVPLNEKVVRPYWINHISHDVPFRDGRSGTLKIKLTAESPIFVRRGEAKPPQNNNERSGAQQEAYEFEQDTAGNYFLPGSSVRGMIRSVIETLSFGRMIGRVSERRYALRDLSGAMKEEYLSHFKANLPDHQKIRGGWLRYDPKTGKYLLRDADVPGRISRKTLQNISGVNISDYFSGQGFNQKEDSEKAAKRKYKLFEEQGQDRWITNVLDFTEGVSDKGGRKICHYIAPDDDQQTKFPGRIVLTGQPGPRAFKNGKWTGKHLEFIFWESNNPRVIEVPEQVVADFKFAYFDDNPKEQSVDYEWRKKQLDAEEEIPVFWKRELDRSGQPTVKHFGLSYLYKLPYEHTVEESIRETQKDAEAYDLADAIFGLAGTSQKKSELDFLKGRVQFSHAKASSSVSPLQIERVILGEPRASFYPTYMAQKVSENGKTGLYNTFMDDSPIAGRKRYPVLDGPTRKTRTKDEKGENLSENIFTKFRPLPAGTTFTGQLHYHNLRKVELGALLSALTFHGSEQSRHQVGMGKPLGFGRVKIEVEGLPAQEQTELMLRYEAYMDMELGRDDAWRISKQVHEVVALTTPTKKDDIPTLSGEFPYNSLSEFRSVKSKKGALRRHSDMREEKLAVGLENSASKRSFLEELEADKKHFTSKGIADVKVVLREVKKKLRYDIEKRIAALRQHSKDVQRQAEQFRIERIEERRKKEKVAKEEEAQTARDEQAYQNALKALEDGPEYANLFLGRPREFWKKLALIVSDYLELVAPVHQPSAKDGTVPIQWQDGLKEKALEVRQRMPSKDWKKKMSDKQADVDAWFGETKKFKL
jgi:CRISPR-associated protein (TIGR03986 family)